MLKELMTQAADFQELISNGYEDESLPQIDGLKQEDASDSLSRFLANVALASEVTKEEDKTHNTPQVTISTIHAAKGLEWPIVFIPGAYQGSIPHSRAEDTDEERRLLYVAMTRAKALLKHELSPQKLIARVDNDLSLSLCPWPQSTFRLQGPFVTFKYSSVPGSDPPATVSD
ncbi:uncharacterized protein EAF02_000812 [Botrytis sinoallii]|uniref:uncharacterized protein n=1 Tax=Botrytis sinoallii TaxID=1463999 RepID=UPI0018FFC5E1|nr:uncharacterized protein EAF02_000812 [Botrytis sinoallii]KAF7893274.1 hypothetical protein EAF02_000812 [Botrytis sinoallii]